MASSRRGSARSSAYLRSARKACSKPSSPTGGGARPRTYSCCTASEKTHAAKVLLVRRRRKALQDGSSAMILNTLCWSEPFLPPCARPLYSRDVPQRLALALQWSLCLDSVQTCLE